ncbi:thioesterase family protein [Streptomyces sp. NPDC001406]|uniref:thioesterase family protein n=1 Tax=Streptomyces sp. NPDC001406 TaxID=3364572 RepID=UPI0036BE96E7
MRHEVTEAATPFVETGRTTVGTALRVEHVRATRVGECVDVFAEPPAAAGRRLTFRVRAVDGSGRLVAEGEIDRAVVDRERFLSNGR